jgi:hypothetical protein
MNAGTISLLVVVEALVVPVTGVAAKVGVRQGRAWFTSNVRADTGSEVDGMAKAGGAIQEALDFDEVLDRALEMPQPKGRPPTKTEQLRQRREKLVRLQGEGYTELELAKMLGVSKDTLRKALYGDRGAKAKKVPRTAHSTRAKVQPETTSTRATETKKVAGSKGTPRDDHKEFPTNDRF